jgi:hypothetical protein
MNWLRRFWSHTVVQISTWLISIILGAYLGYLAAGWSEKTRELSYTVSPVRTNIVKAGEVSALSVSYKDVPVTTDVSSVQVRIWNQGSDAIRQAHILQPLVISTADQTPILEVTVRKQTRPDIVQLQHDDSMQQSGLTKVSWNILEQGDGGIIQLILAGKPDVKISAVAVIEGQRAIREVAFDHRMSSVERSAIIVSQVMIAVVMVLVAYWSIKEMWQGKGISNLTLSSLAAALGLLLVLMLYILSKVFRSYSPTLPPGF